MAYRALAGDGRLRRAPDDFVPVLERVKVPKAANNQGGLKRYTIRVRDTVRLRHGKTPSRRRVSADENMNGAEIPDEIPDPSWDVD